MVTKNNILIFLFSIMVLVMIYIATCSGSTTLTINDIVSLFTGEKTQAMQVVFLLRFPRIVLTLICGIALGISTVFLQIVTKNPLAEAGLLGISSGAQLGYSSLILFAPAAYWFAPIASIFMGLVVCFLLLKISNKKKPAMVYFLIAGVAIQAFLHSINQIISQLADPTQTIELTSSFNAKNWSDVWQLGVPVLLLVIVILFIYSRSKLLSFDETFLQRLGVPVFLLQSICLMIAVALASLTTAYVGVLSFLGILSAQIAFRLTNQYHYSTLILASLIGSFLLLAADTIGRTLFLPLEIPANQILAILGAPFLLYLLIKKGTLFWK
ncbi:FecCD family ABC transporter permease [Enterococcus bulliens]